MPHWKEQQLQQLLSETNEQRMFYTATSLAKQLGMEYFSFVTRTHLATPQPQVKIYNNYPSAWNERYQRCNYLSIDPILAHCHRSLLPILWEDEVFRQTPELWEEARRFGLCYGWSQSAHDLRQNESILSVARNHTPVDTQEFYDTAGQTIWLCNLMHTLIFERKSTKPEPAYFSSKKKKMM